MKIDSNVLAQDGSIDIPAWMQRIALHTSVGRCSCGGPLDPQRPDHARGVTYLELRCALCGESATAIAGRPVRRRPAYA